MHKAYSVGFDHADMQTENTCYLKGASLSDLDVSQRDFFWMYPPGSGRVGSGQDPGGYFYQVCWRDYRLFLGWVCLRITQLEVKVAAVGEQYLAYFV